MANYLPKIMGFFINLVGLFSSRYAAHLAVTLFSTPFKGKIKPTEAEYLKEASQENVLCNNLSIKTYHWKGKKETILLAHGWESNTYRWKDLIKYLKKLDYNIVALDAPAHGNSSGHNFNAIIYSKCITKVAQTFNASVIIGHSIGGMATVFSHYNSPLKLTRKIILLGAPSNFVGIFYRYKTMMGFNKKVNNAMNTYILKEHNHLPEYFSMSNFSKNFKIKGLVIHDKKDKIIPYQDGLDFKASYKNATFITTNGLGHGLKSDEVYNYILDFLKA